MTKNKKHGRAHTAEFRNQAVNLFLSQDRSAEQVAQELGIKGYLLRSWVRQSNANKNSSPGADKTLLDELASIKKENKNLKMEVEILKKAAAYFAKNLS